MDKLENYLQKMESDLNALQAKMKEEDPSQITFGWLSQNNETLKIYVTNLSIGANLDSEQQNQKAYEETFKKYVETMNLFYKISAGTEFFKIA